MKRLNCFISYHHKNDQKYVEKLREIYKDIKVADYSLKKDISDLDEDGIYNRIKFNMNHCAVTIVLVGKKTALRKWIDWEIWASLMPFRNKEVNYQDGFRPCGLLAIYLPGSSRKHIPERLQDNIDSKYAVSMNWKNIDKKLIWKLTMANRRRKYPSLIDNKRKRVKKNHYKFLGIKL